MTSDPAHSDHTADLLERLRASRLPVPRHRRRIRRDAGVSLREMAAALAVSTMTLHRWEKGTEPLRRADAIAYRNLLDELDGLSE